MDIKNAFSEKLKTKITNNKVIDLNKNGFKRIIKNFIVDQQNELRKNQRDKLDEQIVNEVTEYKNNPFKKISIRTEDSIQLEQLHHRFEIIKTQFKNLNNRFDQLYLKKDYTQIQRQILNFMFDTKLVQQRENDLFRKRSQKQINIMQSPEEILEIATNGADGLLSKSSQFYQKLKQNQDLLNRKNINIKRRSSHNNIKAPEITTKQIANQEFVQSHPNHQQDEQLRIINFLMSYANMNIYNACLEYDPMEDSIHVITNKSIKFTRVKSLHFTKDFNHSFWYRKYTSKEQFSGIWKVSNEKIDGNIELAIDKYVGNLGINLKQNDKRKFLELRATTQPCNLETNDQEFYQIIHVQEQPESLLTQLKLIWQTQFKNIDFDSNQIKIQYKSYQKELIIEYENPKLRRTSSQSKMQDDLRMTFQKRSKGNEIDLEGTQVFSQNQDEIKLDFVMGTNSVQCIDVYFNAIKLKAKQTHIPIFQRNNFFKPDTISLPCYLLKSSFSLDIYNSKESNSDPRKFRRKMSMIQDREELVKMMEKGHDTHPLKVTINVKQVKDKVKSVMHAFKLIRRLNLMRIITPKQFIGEIFSNKDQMVRFQGLQKTYKLAQETYDDVINSVAHEKIKKSWRKNQAVSVGVLEQKAKQDALREFEYLYKYFHENKEFLENKKTMKAFITKFKHYIQNCQFQPRLKTFIDHEIFLKEQQLKAVENSSELNTHINSLTKANITFNNQKNVQSAAQKSDLTKVKSKQTNISEKHCENIKYNSLNHLDSVKSQIGSNHNKFILDKNVQLNNTFNINRQLNQFNVTKLNFTKLDEFKTNSKDEQINIQYNDQDIDHEQDQIDHEKDQVDHNLVDKTPKIDQKVFKNDQNKNQENYQVSSLKNRKTQSTLQLKESSAKPNNLSSSSALPEIKTNIDKTNFDDYHLQNYNFNTPERQNTFYEEKGNQKKMMIDLRFRTDLKDNIMNKTKYNNLNFPSIKWENDQSKINIKKLDARYIKNSKSTPQLSQEMKDIIKNNRERINSDKKSSKGIQFSKPYEMIKSNRY